MRAGISAGRALTPAAGAGEGPLSRVSRSATRKGPKACAGAGTVSCLSHVRGRSAPILYSQADT
eukprot:1625492-Prorocentrum_lima.AAC.1